MITSESVREENIVEQARSHFLREYSDERQCLRELLRFWATHPHARFDHLAVLHAAERDSVKAHINDTLKYLVDQGVVTANTCNGMCLYSLTEDESLRKPVLELSACGASR